ncbi:MAG: YHS domain-containing (seleno)protein [Pseudomonadota bacterium]
MKTLLKALGATFVLVFSAGSFGSAYAEKAPVYTGILSGTAVGGYDTVSYFQGTPVKGSKEFETTYKGATWRFASQENLDQFTADPAAYAPQYGGYCAWAVAQGYTAKGDPKYARVVDGKLYLNFNADVQSQWEQNIPGFIAQADANWPSVLSE